VDGILRVIGSLKGNDSSAFGRSVLLLVYIGADHVAGLTEEILQVLPADGEW
jgi:hypothetical protein